MVLVIGHNSTWQNTYHLKTLKLNEVNRIERVFTSAAGKGGNVARVLNLLGVEANLLAYTGGPNGEKFLRDLRDDGIGFFNVPIENETRMCTTLIEEGGRVTELTEPAPSISEDERASFWLLFEKKITEAGFLVISGTSVQGESFDCYYRYIQRAHELNTPVLLDSYRQHGERALEASPDILKINSRELELLLGRKIGETMEDKIRDYREVLKRYGLRWIVITRGAKGAEGFDGKTLLTGISPEVEPINPIGSGDAFSAGIVYELLVDSAATGDKARDRFTDPGMLRKALVAGVALGTANCLSLKPGRIDLSEFKNLRKQVRVNTG